jgi:hypothetical protein
MNLRKKLGKERTGDGGCVLGEGEKLVRIHALLEDLLKDRNYSGDLLRLAHPRRNQQESLLGQVLLPVVELAGRNFHLRQTVALRPSGKIGLLNCVSGSGSMGSI